MVSHSCFLFQRHLKSLIIRLEIYITKVCFIRLMYCYWAILNFDSNLSLIWMVLRFLFLFACELTYHITIICIFCVISIYCLLCIASQICLLNIVFTNSVSANSLSTAKDDFQANIWWLKRNHYDDSERSNRN